MRAALFFCFYKKCSGTKNSSRVRSMLSWNSQMISERAGNSCWRVCEARGSWQDHTKANVTPTKQNSVFHCFTQENLMFGAFFWFPMHAMLFRFWRKRTVKLGIGYTCMAVPHGRCGRGSWNAGVRQNMVTIKYGDYTLLHFFAMDDWRLGELSKRTQIWLC